MPRPTVQECRARLTGCPPEHLAALLEEYDEDPRSSVRALAVAARKSIARDAAESARLDSMMSAQDRLHEQGCAFVAGVDEVGRGALAGPVTACAVVLPAEARIVGLDDSKRLDPARRELVAARVRSVAIAVALHHSEAAEIDLVGIAEATRSAMRRAVHALGVAVDHVLVDGDDARIGHAATPVVRGDSSCACIAAASVIAKTERDALMVGLASQVPGYGLDVHKGYGTPEHLDALRRLGPSPIHRRSFGPCSGTGPLF